MRRSVAGIAVVAMAAGLLGCGGERRSGAVNPPGNEDGRGEPVSSVPEEELGPPQKTPPGAEREVTAFEGGGPDCAYPYPEESTRPVITVAAASANAREEGHTTDPKDFRVGDFLCLVAEGFSRRKPLGLSISSPTQRWRGESDPGGDTDEPHFLRMHFVSGRDQGRWQVTATQGTRRASLDFFVKAATAPSFEPFVGTDLPPTPSGTVTFLGAGARPGQEGSLDIYKRASSEESRDPEAFGEAAQPRGRYSFYARVPVRADRFGVFVHRIRATRSGPSGDFEVRPKGLLSGPATRSITKFYLDTDSEGPPDNVTLTPVPK